MNTFDKYFTEAEERQLFKTIRRVKGDIAQRDYCWMRLARLTGIRVTPLSKLTVGDAFSGLELGYLEIGEFNKNQKYQKIPLVKESKSLLKTLVKLARRYHKESDLPDYERALIVSRNGDGMCTRAMQKRFKNWIVESGLKKGTVHWLRHTFAKRFLKKNDNSANALIAIQQLLGHSDLKTTAIYVQPDKESIMEMLNNAS